MKRCSYCCKKKPLSGFHSRGISRPGQYSSCCKACRRKVHRDHYNKNKRRYIEQAVAQKLALAEVLRTLKDGSCADCKINYPHWVMQFDHVTPGSKLANVSALVRSGSKKKLLVEAAKCQLVCANCHATRTYTRRRESSKGKTEPFQG